MIRAAAISCGLWSVMAPGSALGLTLDLPQSAQETLAQTTAGDSYLVPTGPITNGTFEHTRHSGALSQRAFRISTAGISTEQLIAPLRAQLIDAGYNILFECETDSCGGFDFRFQTDVLPAPDMFVNLGDFRFVSASGPKGYVTILASRSAEAGYLQITQTGAAAKVTTQASMPTAPVVSGDISLALANNGHAILGDLRFESGAATLAGGPFTSLEAVKQFLTDNPDLTLALVGHTDAAGSLEGNIALSKRRAQAVRSWLIDNLGADGTRLEAEGMGYLAPIATNLTKAGRQKNRRVEVIIISTRP